MSFPRLVPSALVAASLLAVAAPHATAQNKERSFGQGKAAGALLSRNELRECMTIQQRLKTGREETLQVQARLQKDKEDITRRGEELKEQLVWLDRTSQEQVDKYNAQSTEHDKLIDAYQARATGFNAQVDALQADRDAFARSCENRRFDEKEENAIKAGK